MAHDDHFETVEIAWSWHHYGIFLDDGTLRWEGKPDHGVLRSAAYNLFMLGLMKFTAFFGVERLDLHMYFNRLVHALLSLLPVIYGYRYLKENTDERMALYGGLLLAGHFLMPFLAVRNLVEMVAGNFLIPGLYYADRASRRNAMRIGDGVIAGIFCGLALMIRYQAAAAIVVVPIAMIVAWIVKGDAVRFKSESKLRIVSPAVTFAATILLMIVLQAVLDLWTHQRFWGSFRILFEHIGEPLIPGPWYRHVLLLFVVMIPPFSLLFIGSIFRLEVIRRHLVLWSALVSFVLIHSLIAEKQERFMATILPLLLIVGVAGMYQLIHLREWGRSAKGVCKALVVLFIAVNVAGLAVFTFNYGKRGAVDPLVYLSKQPYATSVLFDSTERRLFIPYAYWNHDRAGAIPLFAETDLDSAISRGQLSAGNPPKFAVIFTDSNLEEHLARLQERIGRYEVVHHSEPSLVDAIANKLNPRYNRRNESWVVRLIE